MTFTKVAQKEIPPILCELVKNATTNELAIHILRATEVGMWEGWAIFPDTMGDEAYIRFSMLHTETDVEGVIRDWAEDGVIDQYQAIMAME
jgi:hypothetical protein